LKAAGGLPGGEPDTFSASRINRARSEMPAAGFYGVWDSASGHVDGAFCAGSARSETALIWNDRTPASGFPVQDSLVCRGRRFDCCGQYARHHSFHR